MGARRFALVLVLLGAAVASATPMPGAAQEGHEGPTVELVVQNRASTDAHVYVLRGGQMVPVGFVEATATETLTIPSIFIELGGAIQLIADPLASSDWYKSDPVVVRPEDDVSFTIEDDVAHSSVTVEEGAR